jgi:hypothetical protein
MEHRGYTGSVEFDAVEGYFYGRVLDLKDTITYEADCEARLESAFRDAVDEYLDQCWACEQAPEQPPAAVQVLIDPPPIGRQAGRESASRPALPIHRRRRRVSARAAPGRRG